MALEVDRILQQSKEHPGQWAKRRAVGGTNTASDEQAADVFQFKASPVALGAAASPAPFRPRCVNGTKQPLGTGRDIAWTSGQSENSERRTTSRTKSRLLAAGGPLPTQQEQHHEEWQLHRPRRPRPGYPNTYMATTATHSPATPGAIRTVARRAAPSAGPSFMPIAALLNPHTGVKRRRSRHDVDGPNTADLSSKKRRLRLDLVTSRLSRPYSEPASHVHCRYGSMRRVATTAVANKAFIGGGHGATAANKKASTNADPSSSSFLRFSIMNRMRKRLGLKGPGVLKVGRADAALGGTGAAAQSSWHPDKSESAPAGKSSSPSGSLGLTSGQGPVRRAVARRAELPHPANARVSVKAKTHLPQHYSRLSNELPAIRMSQRDRPGPSRDATDQRRLSKKFQDDAGEDGFGSLDLDEAPLDDGLAEEPDDVYCDFGMLFGRTAEGLSPEGADRLAERGLDPNDDLAWLLT